MSALSLRLPESLHRQVRELAEREDVSINQFIAMAVAEKMSALLTVEYLEARARRGSRAHLQAFRQRQFWNGFIQWAHHRSSETCCCVIACR